MENWTTAKMSDRPAYRRLRAPDRAAVGAQTKGQTMRCTARGEIGQRADGYTLWLSAADTEAWARKPGAAWPCSTLAGCALVVTVDANGLLDYAVGEDRPDLDGLAEGAGELEAIVADHLRDGLRHLWPTWAAVPATA